MTPEIRAFEYAMGLFSVLIGLAVADVAMSFHRLARSRAPVRWDPLALTAALYTLCMAVYMWFDLWGVRHFAATRHFLFYLAVVAQLFVLFLVAAASLPDEAGPHDLSAYYAGNRRYFWSLMSLFQLGYSLLGLYFAASETAHLARGPGALLYGLMWAPALVSVALLLTRSRVAHYLGLAALIVLMVVHYGAAQIN